MPTPTRNSKLVTLSLFILILAWLASAWWLRQKYLPYDVNNTDISTCLFQAQTFADGNLYRPSPPLKEFFQQWQAIVRERSYAYYAPVHALFLALPVALGIDPALITLLLSGLSLLFVFLWVSELSNQKVGLVAAIALALSPFFAANAPSLLSHSTALFLTSLFLWLTVRWVKGAGDSSRFYACAAGAVLALIFATRSLNALALALVWLPWVFRSRRMRSKATGSEPLLLADRHCEIAFLIGSACVMIPLLLYYRHLAGHWCLDLFTDYWPRNRYGFGHDLGRGEPGHFFQTTATHDWQGMLANQRYSFLALSEWWTGNAIFSIVLLAAGISTARICSKSSANQEHPFPLTATFACFTWPVVHIFLYSLYYTPSTAFTGPRYLSELMPVLAFGTGWVFFRLAQTNTGKVIAGILGVFLFLYSSHFKSQFYAFNAKGIPARQQVESTVKNGAVPPSLVFLRSFWLGHPYPIFGNRSDLKGSILYACDRGEEDKKLVALYPDRNAYILAVTPQKAGAVKTELIQIYEAQGRRWLREPQTVTAPFFVGAGFTAPLELTGETARELFYPKPEEIKPQNVTHPFVWKKYLTLRWR